MLIFAKSSILQHYLSPKIETRMKLALVRRAYSPVGGAELYLQRLIAGLASAGHELHLLTESWTNSTSTPQVHQLPTNARRAARPWAFAHAVRRHLDSHAYDCVFSLDRTLRQDIYRAGDGVHRVWLAQRRRYLPWWRTLWTGGFHRAMLKLEKQTLDPANTRFVIVNSEMVRREIESNFGFPSDRIILIRNGVDLTRFRPQPNRREETRRKYNLSPTDFVCLFVGSGWDRKGLQYLIDAIPIAQDFLTPLVSNPTLKLLVAGKGRPKTSHPNIVFTGPVSDIENLYAAADLFTFVPIYEPSANVCIEALAAGLPVITSRFNGAAELITKPELGAVLEDPSDHETLAAKIAHFATRPGHTRISVPGDLISIERNVRETIEVLERAERAHPL